MSFVSFAHHNIQGVRRKADPAHILIAWRLITVLSFVLKQTVCCNKNCTQIHKLKFVHISEAYEHEHSNKIQKLFRKYWQEHRVIFVISLRDIKCVVGYRNIIRLIM